MFIDIEKYFKLIVPKVGDFESFREMDKKIINIIRNYSLKLQVGYVLLNYNELSNKYDITFIDTDMEILENIKKDLRNFAMKNQITIHDEYKYASLEVGKNFERHSYLLINKSILYYAYKK